MSSEIRYTLVYQAFPEVQNEERDLLKARLGLSRGKRQSNAVGEKGCWALFLSNVGQAEDEYFFGGGTTFAPVEGQDFQSVPLNDWIRTIGNHSVTRSDILRFAEPDLLDLLPDEMIARCSQDFDGPQWLRDIFQDVRGQLRVGHCAPEDVERVLAEELALVNG